MKTPDERFMRRAIALSRKGFPAPNPHVGCIIVKNGLIVGEGYHINHGGPHAEVNALAQAGDQAIGATAYVTLEPCNHEGITGPCSEALIRANVARVVYAVPDPNPKAMGGADRLRSENIQVEPGLLAQEAEEANEVFLHALRAGRPFITLKAAIGMDGRLAMPDGRSKWITGAKARKEGMRLRAEMGCVLIGARTAIADDPLLTARIRGVVNQPLRVIQTDRDFDLQSLKMTKEPGETIAMEKPIPELLHDLRARGVIGVLVEGGAATHARFLASGLVDRVDLFVAPRILGDGPIWTSIVNWPGDPLGELPRWRLDQVKKLGEDLHLSYRPRIA